MNKDESIQEPKPNISDSMYDVNLSGYEQFSKKGFDSETKKELKDLKREAKILLDKHTNWK